MNDFVQDLRYGVRRLLRHPVLNLVIVLTLALCIGSSSALFSVMRHVLVEPFPYVDQSRLAYLVLNMPQLGGEQGQVSVPEYLEIADQRQVFAHAMTGAARDVNLTGNDRPERVRGAAVTASVFPMLGVKPLVGRVFTPQEDRPGGERLVVMGYDLWHRRFAGSRVVVGQQLLIEGQSYTVLGVMPQRFAWWGADLWFPLNLDATQTDRTQRRLTLMARVRPDLDLPQAVERLNGLARRLEHDHPEVPEYRGMQFGLRSLRDEVIRDVRPALMVLFGVVALVFLIACANVANLFLAQAAERRREMALRVAMGANRHRLVRQLLTESLLLALTGGACGYLLAHWGVRLIAALIPFGYFPAETEVSLDPWASVFTLAVSVLAALLFGLAPALQTWRQNQVTSLKEGGKGSGSSRASRRGRELLVVGEVALALVVLVGAGLMLRSFQRLTAIQPGFEAANVLTLQLAAGQDRYPERFQVIGLFHDLLARFRGIPGVIAAGATNALPLTSAPSDRVTLEGESAGDAGQLRDADFHVVTPGYLEAMGVALRQGRMIGDQDGTDAPHVTVVDETMARRFWHGQSPLGKRLKLGAPDSTNAWMTVVGVVAAVAGEHLDAEPRQDFYIPHAQRETPRREMVIVLRTQGSPENMAPPVRRAVAAWDANQPISRVRPMEEVVLDSLGAKRLTVCLLSFFALLALLLATVGIFAVLANAVSQRTREIGIRMAMGAQLKQVIQLFLGEGLRLTVIGIVAGLLIAAAASHAMASFVYGISTLDVPTFAGVALLFLAIAAVASYLPTRRAAKVDPTEALRYE